MEPTASSDPAVARPGPGLSPNCYLALNADTIVMQFDAGAGPGRAGPDRQTAAWSVPRYPTPTPHPLHICLRACLVGQCNKSGFFNSSASLLVRTARSRPPAARQAAGGPGPPPCPRTASENGTGRLFLATQEHIAYSI